MAFAKWFYAKFNFYFSIVQSLSRGQFFGTPWTAACQASLSITNSQSLLKLMSIESVMPSNHLILCHPLLLLPSIFPSIRVFANESVLRIRWPKYWRFSSSPSNEYSGLISFRIDWFDLLAVQWCICSYICTYIYSPWKLLFLYIFKKMDFFSSNMRTEPSKMSIYSRYFWIGKFRFLKTSTLKKTKMMENSSGETEITTDFVKVIIDI